MHNINGPDPHDELVMNVTSPILSNTDMGSSESNALRERANLQRYEEACHHPITRMMDAPEAVTPPDGFTTQRLKRWVRVMDALEESKVKVYFDLAILAMAMVAISYCGNLPLLNMTNSPSAPSFAPSPAPSSADDYYRIVLEDRKALFRPFYSGIITVVLCMSGVILSRWRTYIDPVPDKKIDGDKIHSARVEFADPFVHFSVLIASFAFLLFGYMNDLYKMGTRRAFQAQIDTGQDGAVWRIVVLLSTFLVPVTVLVGFALRSCYKGRVVHANPQE